MIKFEYQFDKRSPKIVTRMSPESTLSEVVEQFELFLKAAGYSFDRKLDFTEEEMREPIT